MNSNQHRIVHNLHFLEKVAIRKHLFPHAPTNLRWQCKRRLGEAGPNVVVLLDFFSGFGFSSRDRSLQIKEVLQMLVGIKDRVHNNEFDISPQMVKLDAIHSQKLGQEGVGILTTMTKVVRQYPTEEFGLGIGHGLDHVATVVTVEEKLSRLGIGYELDEIGVATNA